MAANPNTLDSKTKSESDTQSLSNANSNTAFYEASKIAELSETVVASTSIGASAGTTNETNANVIAGASLQDKDIKTASDYCYVWRSNATENTIDGCPIEMGAAIADFSIAKQNAPHSINSSDIDDNDIFDAVIPNQTSFFFDPKCQEFQKLSIADGARRFTFCFKYTAQLQNKGSTWESHQERIAFEIQFRESFMTLLKRFPKFKVGTFRYPMYSESIVEFTITYRDDSLSQIEIPSSSGNARQLKAYQIILDHAAILLKIPFPKVAFTVSEKMACANSVQSILDYVKNLSNDHLVNTETIPELRKQIIHFMDRELKEESFEYFGAPARDYIEYIVLNLPYEISKILINKTKPYTDDYKIKAECKTSLLTKILAIAKLGLRRPEYLECWLLDSYGYSQGYFGFQSHAFRILADQIASLWYELSGLEAGEKSEGYLRDAFEFSVYAKNVSLMNSCYLKLAFGSKHWPEIFFRVALPEFDITKSDNVLKKQSFHELQKTYEGLNRNIPVLKGLLASENASLEREVKQSYDRKISALQEELEKAKKSSAAEIARAQSDANQKVADLQKELEICKESARQSELAKETARMELETSRRQQASVIAANQRLEELAKQSQIAEETNRKQLESFRETARQSELNIEATRSELETSRRQNRTVMEAANKEHQAQLADVIGTSEASQKQFQAIIDKLKDELAHVKAAVAASNKSLGATRQLEQLAKGNLMTANYRIQALEKEVVELREAVKKSQQNIQNSAASAVAASTAVSSITVTHAAAHAHTIDYSYQRFMAEAGLPPPYTTVHETLALDNSAISSANNSIEKSK